MNLAPPPTTSCLASSRLDRRRRCQCLLHCNFHASSTTVSEASPCQRWVTPPPPSRFFCFLTVASSTRLCSRVTSHHLSYLFLLQSPIFFLFTDLHLKKKLIENKIKRVIVSRGEREGEDRDDDDGVWEIFHSESYTEKKRDLVYEVLRGRRR